MCNGISDYVDFGYRYLRRRPAPLAPQPEVSPAERLLALILRRPGLNGRQLHDIEKVRRIGNRELHALAAEGRVHYKPGPRGAQLWYPGPAQPS